MLIVEDQPKLAALLARGLREEGHATDVAGRGEDALWMAGAAPYDAIVLDIMLPGIDGLETCRELRRLGVWTPVLMLTARDAVDDRVTGLDAGGDDYLTKPFSFDELLARVRVQLKRGTPPKNGGTVIRAGTLVLDLTTRRAHLGGTVIDLTTREFQVLRQLAEHPDEVISRERLLSEVWGYHFEPGSNVVEVCIRRLRQKLGPDAPIQTVRHAGYRVSAT